MGTSKTEDELYNRHVFRGEQLFAFKKQLEAEQELFAAIALQPMKATAHIALAQCYVYWPERHGKALGLIEHAMSMAPQNAHLMVLESVALQRKERLGEALASTELALGLRPGFSYAMNQRTCVLNDLDRIEEAFQNARSNLEWNSTDPDATRLFVWISKKAGREEEAFPLIEFLLQQNPNDPTSHHFAGYVAAKKGHAEKAIEHFQAALNLDPVSARNQLAIALGFNTRSFLFRWHARNQKLIHKYMREWLVLSFLASGASWLFGGLWLGGDDNHIYIFQELFGPCVMLFSFSATLLGIPSFANLCLFSNRKAWRTLSLELRVNAFAIGMFYSAGWIIEIYQGAWLCALMFILLPAHFIWIGLSGWKPEKLS